MTKQEFLAASLPHELQVLIEKGVTKTYEALHYSDEFEPEFEKYTPIVRPLESLTKECVQKDYNNGKPFVPIVELAKMAEGSDILILDYKQKESMYGVKYIDQVGDKCAFTYHKETSTFAVGFIDYGFFDICMYQLQLFQQLLKWHFDLITEEYEKVYVTDEFNPYK